MPNKWPLVSKLHFSAKMPNLYVFIHPECSCSIATLSELDKLKTRVLNQVHLHVVILKYKTEMNSNLQVQEAQRVVGKDNVFFDEAHLEAKLFGAETSGQTYLFDEAGNLIFNGGITISRAHEGDNLGSQSIDYWIKNRVSILKKSEVFGCSLTETESQSFINFN